MRTEHTTSSWECSPLFEEGRGTGIAFGSYLGRERQEHQDHLESKTGRPVCITSSRRPSLGKPNHTPDYVVSFPHTTSTHSAHTTVLRPHPSLPLASLFFSLVFSPGLSRILIACSWC